MAGRCAIRWLLFALLAASFPALRSNLAAQEVARFNARIPRNSKEIRLAADAVAQMDDAGRKYYRLLGSVFIEQGVARVRATRAVVRFDTDRSQRDGVYVVEVYAESGVTLEDGPAKQAFEQAVVEFETTVEPHPAGGQLITQSLAADPFFARAKAAFAPPVIVPAVATTRNASAQVPDQTPGEPPLAPVMPFAPPPAIVAPPIAPAPPRQLRIGPRSGRRFEIGSDPEQKSIVLTGGVILSISNIDKIGLVDIEADNVVIWTKGDSEQFLRNLNSPQGEHSRESEFYLSGNVVIRSAEEGEERVLRAEQVYYDVNRNVAVAIQGDVELREKGIPEPIHFRATELFQIGPNEFEAERAEIFSSKLPSDPGLKVLVRHATVTTQQIPRTNIFGLRFLDRITGQPENVTERVFHGEDVRFELENVPFFYLPFLNGSTQSLAGPLQSFDFRHDGIFGYQFYTTFDVFNLLAINQRPGLSWNLMLDELTSRGPAFGTNFGYYGDNLWGLPGHAFGLLKYWAIFDHGNDLIGAFRGTEVHPLFRERLLFRHVQDMPDDWIVMGQVSYLSDKNFMEQFYKPEFDQEPNQETFLYVNKRLGNIGGNLLVEDRIRNWVTETSWLPKAEGRVLGWSFLDRFTYDAKASVGYAELRPTALPPFPLTATDAATNTGRFDFWQDLAMPFRLGPLKIVPYGVIDLTEYTTDLTGNARGRFYAAGGVRGSLSLSRLYPDVESELFNLQGLYHKSVFTGNYYVAHSDTPYSRLPQLDRLNNDASDQALRDITPFQPLFNPTNGVALMTSPVYNPQLYAIRRLEDERVDTLDSIQVIQLDWRNRWQTKRGFPGMEHTVDWLTIDTSVSLYPNSTRDNFGSTVGFIEYDAAWNMGDRTALVSNGWFDPFAGGARYFAIAALLNRPDRTSFNIGFRYVDPIMSRVVSAAANYVFSPKYAMTIASSYDFGQNHGLSNALVFTRIGTDLQFNVSVTYNPLLNNFGFSIEVLPLIAAAQRLGLGATDPNNVRGR
ncbi:MAG: hypothetical protein ACJ8F7_04315 [Gemmataceae bacterium]